MHDYLKKTGQQVSPAFNEFLDKELFAEDKGGKGIHRIDNDFLMNGLPLIETRFRAMTEEEFNLARELSMKMFVIEYIRNGLENQKDLKEIFKKLNENKALAKGDIDLLNERLIALKERALEESEKIGQKFDALKEIIKSKGSKKFNGKLSVGVKVPNVEVREVGQFLLMKIINVVETPSHVTLMPSIPPSVPSIPSSPSSPSTESDDEEEPEISMPLISSSSALPSTPSVLASTPSILPPTPSVPSSALGVPSSPALPSTPSVSVHGVPFLASSIPSFVPSVPSSALGVPSSPALPSTPSVLVSTSSILPSASSIPHSAPLDPERKIDLGSSSRVRVPGDGSGTHSDDSDGDVTVSVDPQGRYILIPSFEVFDSDDEDRSKNRSWGKSSIWYVTINPLIEKEFSLLEKALEAVESHNDSLLESTIQKLQEINPGQYSGLMETTRDGFSEEFFVSRLKELSEEVRGHGTPCAQIMRHDVNKTKTNSIEDTKSVDVSTFGLKSNDTVRVQMNRVEGVGGTLFIDLHFDDEGNCVGCAFLNLADKKTPKKFGECYVSGDIDKTAMAGIINSLSDGFFVNGKDVSKDLLASLEGRKFDRSRGEDDLELDPRGLAAKHRARDTGTVGLDLGR